MQAAWIFNIPTVRSMRPNKYPYWRVVLGFSLTPLPAGVLFVIITYVPALFQDGIYSGLLISITMIFFGELLFFVPAIILGVGCAALKRNRSWRSSAIAFFFGGGSLYFPFLFFVGGSFQDFLIRNIKQPVALLLAAVTSFLMSWVVLPRQGAVAQIR